MTRPPPPHLVRLPSMLLVVAVVLGLAGFVLAAISTGHAITPVRAAGPSLLSGAIPGPTTGEPIASSTNPLSAVSSPSESATTPLHVQAPATVTRTLRAVSTAYLSAPTRTVTVTHTAWATATVTTTATVTATQTVTAQPTPAGVTP